MADDGQQLLLTFDAKFERYLRNFERAQQQTDQRFRAMEQRAKASATKIDQGFAKAGLSINNSLAKIGSVFAGAVSVRAVANMVDSSIKIQNALKATGLAGDDLKKTYDALFASAQKNATPLEALVTLYSRTSGAAKDLGANQQDLLKFTDGISLAMRVSGQSASESAGALLQLAQALGDGKIQAEEYNSLLDAGRPILQAVAHGLTDAGGSISNLTRLVKDGKVSSEAFFRAFLAGAPSLQSSVSSVETTVSGSLVRLQNVLTDAAGKFNHSTEASQLFGRMVDDVAAQVQSVNFDNLIKQIGSVVKAFNDGVATLDNWAAALGRATGANNIGKSIIGALPGDTVKSYLGGALTIASPDMMQDRIDGAFGTPAPAAGGLTTEQIRAHAKRTGAAQAAPKTERLPAAETVKPVSLADYPVPASSKGGSGSSGGGSRDSYAHELQQLQARTASLQAMTAAQASVNPLIDDYGQALATAEAKQELMNAAQKQGKAVTPEMAADIEKTAQAYGRATAASEQLREKQDEMRQSAEDALGTMKDATRTFIDDLVSGKSAAEALSDALKQVGEAILNNILDTAFSMKSIGGLFGGLFGGGSTQFAAAASGSIFGLFDSGGYTGDGGKYDPAGIVHCGEYVMSKEATRRLGIGNLEALHRGALRGYADGGFVGAPPTIRKPGLQPANSSVATPPAVNINTNVTVNASGGDPSQNADLAARVGKQVELQVKGMVAEQIRLAARPGNFLNTRSR